MKAIIVMKGFLYFLLVTVWGCQSRSQKIKTITEADHTHKAKGYVLQKNEGEVLHDPRGRTMIIKVSPETGATHFTMGTTEMPKGSNIVLHRHDHGEEILFVHRGNGIALVDGDSVNISDGSTLFIPPWNMAWCKKSK